jgi:predicted RNase H-like nuclease (RuvC/YqgF family)
MATLSLSLIEIIVLMLGAITLGITIHFFIVSRKSLRTTALDASGKMGKDLEQWKLKYFNDIEIKDKELSTIRQKLDETEENNNINSIEADEMRKMNKKLQAEMELFRKNTPEKTNDNTAIELIEMQDLNRPVSQLYRQILLK